MGYQKVWVMLPDDLAARICNIADHDEVAPNSLIRQAAADYVHSREKAESALRSAPAVERLLVGVEYIGAHWGPDGLVRSYRSPVVPKIGGPDER